MFESSPFVYLLKYPPTPSNGLDDFLLNGFIILNENSLRFSYWLKAFDDVSGWLIQGNGKFMYIAIPTPDFGTRSSFVKKYTYLQNKISNFCQTNWRLTGRSKDSINDFKSKLKLDSFNKKYMRQQPLERVDRSKWQFKEA